jgi:hypothetical protein
VPHCETCDRFYNPNTLNPDGTCPTCGRPVGEPPVEEKLTRFGREGSPWHFKLVIGITAVYLGFRLVQGIVWAAHHV